MALVGVAAGLSFASGVLGFGSSRKAKKRQRQAEALARQRAAIANIRSRRAAAAAVRRQQAEITSAAIAQGQGGSSAAAGTASSLAAQESSQEGAALQTEALGGAINSTLASANRASEQAQNFAAAGQLIGAGAQLFSSSIQPPATQVPGLPAKVTS